MGKLQKLNKITKKSTAAKQQQTENIITDKKVEINKSLKELKETAFVLRQKLDTLESERNIMDVEYSQVVCLIYKRLGLFLTCILCFHCGIDN